jgi:hypothetical protein
VPSDCQYHAQSCPKRLGGVWEFREPKGGKARSLVIPAPLIRLLKEAWRAQKFLGHSALAVTMRYTNSRELHQVNALSLVA